MAKKKEWRPTAFSFVSGSGTVSLNLTDGPRIGPSLCWGSNRVWRCVQDEGMEKMLWTAKNRNSETMVVRTGPTRKKRLANGQYKYVPDMKKIREMYPEDFIEEPPEDAATEEDD
jgi:hypothetical protein